MTAHQCGVTRDVGMTVMITGREGAAVRRHCWAEPLMGLCCPAPRSGWVHMTSSCLWVGRSDVSWVMGHA